MKTNCTVSVIIPIYNTPKDYLYACIQSFQNQSCKDTELILVDDGSRAEIATFCDSLEKKFSNCTVIHQKNQGVSVARNQGLKQADGEWIMFADPDDFAEPTLIEDLLSEAEKETDILCCCCKILAEDFEDIDHFFSDSRRFSNPDNKNELYLQLLDPCCGQPGRAYTAIGVPWGKLYKKDFLKQNHLWFDPALRRMQDNIFNMYAFYYASTVKYLNEPLYVYRYQHLQNYQAKYNRTNLDTNLSIIRKRKECMEHLGLSKDKALFDAYLIEAFSKFKVIMRYGPLHPKFPGSDADKKRAIQEIMSLSEVQELTQDIQNEKPLKSETDKLIFQLVQGNRWNVLNLLWRITDFARRA